MDCFKFVKLVLVLVCQVCYAEQIQFTLFLLGTSMTDESKMQSISVCVCLCVCVFIRHVRPCKC